MQAYYTIKKVDNYTAQLIKIVIDGRKISHRKVIMESTPTIIRANWNTLARTESF